MAAGTRGPERSGLHGCWALSRRPLWGPRGRGSGERGVTASGGRARGALPAGAGLCQAHSDPRPAERGWSARAKPLSCVASHDSNVKGSKRPTNASEQRPQLLSAVLC